jgi:hypothetical protein
VSRQRDIDEFNRLLARVELSADDRQRATSALRELDLLGEAVRNAASWPVPAPRRESGPWMAFGCVDDGVLAHWRRDPEGPQHARCIHVPELCDRRGWPYPIPPTCTAMAAHPTREPAKEEPQDGP